VSCQNTYYTGPTPACDNVYLNTVITVSGHFFFASGTVNTTFDLFVSKSQTDIENRLRNNFLANHPEVNSGTSGFIIMDIESPHPMDWYTYSTADQINIINAFKTRWAAARAVFPNAKLTAYGFAVPDGQGKNDPAFVNGLAALTGVAVQQGLYDQNINYLAPVLYNRFGPTDGATNWGTAATMARQGLSASLLMKNSVTSASLPLLPLVTYYVANGNSNHNLEHVLDFTLYGVSDPIGTVLGSMVDVIYNEYSLTDFCFWIGSDSEILGANNPNFHKLQDYVCSTGMHIG
jgi:hypothetical protein